MVRLPTPFPTCLHLFRIIINVLPFYLSRVLRSECVLLLGVSINHLQILKDIVTKQLSDARATAPYAFIPVLSKVLGLDVRKGLIVPFPIYHCPTLFGLSEPSVVVPHRALLSLFLLNVQPS